MRTDAEVTAAAERTADLALRCAELTRQRDRARDIAVALEGQVAAVRATIEQWDQGADYDLDPYADRLIDAIRSALDPDPADRGTGEGAS
jgi:hypothetical protein